MEDRQSLDNGKDGAEMKGLSVFIFLAGVYIQGYVNSLYGFLDIRIYIPIVAGILLSVFVMSLSWGK